MLDTTAILIAVALLIGNAFFVGAEFAAMAARRSQLEPLAEAGETLHIELPEGRESDTLGGLITEQLGRFPRVGDEVLVDVRDESRRDDDGLPSPAVARLHVTRLDGWRVDRLVLTIEDLDDAEEGGTHA